MTEPPETNFVLVQLDSEEVDRLSQSSIAHRAVLRAIIKSVLEQRKLAKQRIKTKRKILCMHPIDVEATRLKYRNNKITLEDEIEDRANSSEYNLLNHLCWYFDEYDEGAVTQSVWQIVDSLNLPNKQSNDYQKDCDEVFQILTKSGIIEGVCK
jgi:hypothetical protein